MPLPIHVFSYKNVNNVNKGLGKVKTLPRQPHAGRANRKALGKPVQIAPRAAYFCDYSVSRVGGSTIKAVALEGATRQKAFPRQRDAPPHDAAREHGSGVFGRLFSHSVSEAIHAYN